jgi:hypothetical protein
MKSNIEKMLGPPYD